MSKLHSYRIVVQGKLTADWSHWFQEATLSHETHSTYGQVTIVRLQAVDHSTLHGILDRIRDLNLVLLEVTTVPKQTRVR